jgi:hypothetical protein
MMPHLWPVDTDFALWELDVVDRDCPVCGHRMYNVLPNLSDSTMDLSNRKGSLTVAFGPSKTNVHGFTISGGTRRFARFDGVAGSVVFSTGAPGFEWKFTSGRPRS